MDSSKKDSGRLAKHMDWSLSPFDLSQILLGVGSLLVSSLLPGPPIVRLTPTSGYNQARPRCVVSVSGFPNDYINLVINLRI